MGALAKLVLSHSQWICPFESFLNGVYALSVFDTEVLGGTAAMFHQDCLDDVEEVVGELTASRLRSRTCPEAAAARSGPATAATITTGRQYSDFCRDCRHCGGRTKSSRSTEQPTHTLQGALDADKRTSWEKKRSLPAANLSSREVAPRCVPSRTGERCQRVSSRSKAR